MMQLRVNGRKEQLLSLRKSVYSIGSSSVCELFFPHNNLQPVHAYQKVKDGSLRVVRRGDAGVEVNGINVEAGRALRAGDRVRLGSLELEVLNTDQAGQSPGQDKPVPGWVLHGVNMLNARSYRIDGSVVVGRSSECGIRLGEAHLSRRHARLRANERRLLVEDLGSANGTFVNGKRVAKALLRSGDELRFDSLRFRIIHTANRDDPDETSLHPALKSPPQMASPTAIEVQRESLRRLGEPGNNYPGMSSTPSPGIGIMDGNWPALVMAVVALGLLMWLGIALLW